MRVLKHHVSTQLLLIAALDVVSAAGSYYLANLLLPERALGLLATTGWSLHLNALLFTLFVATGQAATGLHSASQRFRIEGVLARTLVGLAAAAIALGLCAFLLEIFSSRFEWMLAFGICTLLLAATRIATQNMLNDERFRRRVLIYGAGKRASSILQLRRQSDQRGFRLVAFIAAAGDAMTIDDDRVVRDIDVSLLDFARRERVTEIVVAVDDRRRQFPIQELLESKFSGIKVIDLLGFLERETGRVKVDLLTPSWLIFSEGFTALRAQQVAFRLLDVFASIVLFVLALPVMIVVALLILLDDGAPVLYKQRRVGLLGKEFTLYKFRSMNKRAEKEGVAIWATVEDVRVTRIGKLLRKTRLDELPQLFNILRGDMSFVGPRPERPEFVSELAKKVPYYHERHYVKPGLTGWAQLCYPYGASEKDALAKLEYDLYYVKNRSLIFNLVILLQTVEVVLWQKGSR